MKIIHSGKYKRVTINVVKGDICEIPAACISVPGNMQGMMGGGCSGAVRKAAGEEVEIETRSRAPIPLGRCVIVDSKRLSVSNVQKIGYCSIMRKPIDTTNSSIIKASVLHLLRNLDRMGIGSIAIPLFGTGIGRLPDRVSADAIVDSVKTYIGHDSTDKSIREVYLCGYSQKRASGLVQALDTFFGKSLTKCAVIVVDLIEPFVGQNALITEQQAATICNNLNKLIAVAERSRIPVVYIKDVHDAQERELVYTHDHCVTDPENIHFYKDLSILDSQNCFIINKHCYSAFFETDLAEKLKRMECETLLFAGTQTHVCVKYSALHSMFYGFRPIVLVDCTASSTNERHQQGLDEISNYFGEVSHSSHIATILSSPRPFMPYEEL